MTQNSNPYDEIRGQIEKRAAELESVPYIPVTHIEDDERAIYEEQQDSFIREQENQHHEREM